MRRGEKKIEREEKELKGKEERLRQKAKEIKRKFIYLYFYFLMCGDWTTGVVIDLLCTY